MDDFREYLTKEKCSQVLVKNGFPNSTKLFSEYSTYFKIDISEAIKLGAHAFESFFYDLSRSKFIEFSSMIDKLKYESKRKIALALSLLHIRDFKKFRNLESYNITPNRIFDFKLLEIKKGKCPIHYIPFVKVIVESEYNEITTGCVATWSGSIDKLYSFIYELAQLQLQKN